MSRSLKLLREMIILGTMFAVALTGLGILIAVLKWVKGADLVYELVETVLTGATPIGFLMGVVFFAVLLIRGRGRMPADISLRAFVGLSVLAGLLFWTLTGGPLDIPDLEELVAEVGVSTLLFGGIAAAVFKIRRLGGDSGQVPPHDQADLLEVQ